MAQPGALPDPYNMQMAPHTPLAVHISNLQEAMMAHMQDPFSEFHDVFVRTRRLLDSLPHAAPWHEFKLRYQEFMATGELGVDAERFHARGPWLAVTRDLLLREEFDLRGITYAFLPRMFPALQMHNIVVPPPPPAAQGPLPPQPPAQTPPASPPQANSGEGSNSPVGVHVVVDVPGSPEIIYVSSHEEREEPMEEEDPEEEPMEEEDPEEEPMEEEDPEEENLEEENGQEEGENFSGEENMGEEGNVGTQQWRWRPPVAWKIQTTGRIW